MDFGIQVLFTGTDGPQGMGPTDPRVGSDGPRGGGPMVSRFLV